jgi:hypothetical protein
VFINDRYCIDIINNNIVSIIVTNIIVLHGDDTQDFKS